MARKSTRKLWAAHVARMETPTGTSRQSTARTDIANAYALGKPFHGCVLGIDPSLRGTGLAIVDFQTGTVRVRHTQTLKMHRTLSMVECLGIIARSVADCLERFDIRHVAVEESIYVQNFRTAQILGAARGAAIAPCAMRNYPLFEYPPLRIKQAVAGYGRASKQQVLASIRALTGTDLDAAYDEADAVAVAVCHAHTWREK
jgi:crossover junction endodeoxyribonuclease RuvC